MKLLNFKKSSSSGNVGLVFDQNPFFISSDTDVSVGDFKILFGLGRKEEDFAIGSVFSHSGKIYKLVVVHKSGVEKIQLSEKNGDNYDTLASNLEEANKFFRTILGDDYKNILQVSFSKDEELKELFSKLESGSFSTDSGSGQGNKIQVIERGVLGSTFGDLGGESALQERLKEVTRKIIDEPVLKKKRKKAESEKIKLEEKLGKLEDDLSKIDLQLNPEAEKGKFEEQIRSLEKEKKEIEDDLGDSVKNRGEIKKLKDSLEEMKYFKSNAPRTIIPKLESLIKDEESLEITYKRKQGEIESLELEVEELKKKKKKIEEVKSSGQFTRVKELKAEIEDLKKEIRGLEPEVEVSKFAFEKERKGAKMVAFASLLLPLIGLITGIQIILILGVLITLISGVLFFWKFQMGKGTDFFNLDSKLSLYKTKVRVAESDYEMAKDSLKLNDAEIEEFSKDFVGMDLDLKTKEITLDGYKKGVEETIKPKLDKFKIEKEKVLTESNYESLKIAKEKAEEYQEARKKLDDLEFEQMRASRGSSGDDNKEKEKRYDEIIDKLASLSESLKKLEDVGQDVDKGELQVKKVEFEQERQKAMEEVKILESELSEIPDYNITELKGEKADLERMTKKSSMRKGEFRRVKGWLDIADSSAEISSAWDDFISFASQYNQSIQAQERESLLNMSQEEKIIFKKFLAGEKEMPIFCFSQVGSVPFTDQVICFE